MNRTLPRTSFNFRNLIPLDIGNSEINGLFLFWIETLSDLLVLVLKSNIFYAIIPISKVKHPFYMLQILDISHNEFIGIFTIGFLDNFEAMMDVSDNEIELDALSIFLLKGHEYKLWSIQ